jgi:tetratricopeptide (TPR) repeat protein
VNRTQQLVFILLGLALIAWAAPQNDEARKHFESGRELYEAHDDSGESAAQAEAEFRRAVELDPKFATAHAYLGFLAADRQKLQEAEDAYHRALSIDSHCAEAQLGMARLDLQAGRRDDALRKLRQSVADHPEHPLILRELAFTLTTETSSSDTRGVGRSDPLLAGPAEARQERLRCSSASGAGL